MAGQGKETHESLVNLVRFDAPHLLRQQGFEMLVITGEKFMAMALGRKTAGKGRLPDVILYPLDDEPGPPLLVEIGQYSPSKWPSDIPVLHVGVNGAVSLINPTRRQFEQNLANAVRRLLSDFDYQSDL